MKSMDHKFSNGDQIPAYGNEKTHNQVIAELREKNAELEKSLLQCLELLKGCVHKSRIDADGRIKRMYEELESCIPQSSRR